MNINIFINGRFTVLVKNILERKGRDVISIKPNLTLEETAKVLRENKIGVVVISDASDKMCGVLSERDIINAIGKKGKAVLSKTASDYMTQGVYTCALTDSIKEVMNTMTERRIRHLPVVEEGNLVGMISIGDVVKERMAETQAEADALKKYITAG